MSSDTPTLPDRKACARCGKEFTAGETTCTDDGTQLTPIRRDGLSGTVAGKYDIISSLGDGGWGTVYKAQHILLQRPVAIKTLHRHMVESGNALKRFKQEALAGSQLDHPHILGILDFGITDDGVPYIVMDYLEGMSLGEAMEPGGHMEPRRAMGIFAQVASALAHAHRNGVVHRDLKPANIMLVEHDGVPDYVKIVDFGIAKIVKDDSGETSQLTETGQLFGSPLYMSPEQCTGKDLDGRSDIYSLGCVMYRTLTGQPAFQVRDLPDCIYKHVHETPAPFEFVCQDTTIPKDVEAITFKCLQKNPMDRFQTMGELEEAIKAWLDGKKVDLTSHSTEGETRPKVTDTTTRIPAYQVPDAVPAALAAADKISGKLPILETTTNEHSPTPAVPIPTTPEERQAMGLNVKYLIGMVVTSILVLLPIGYFAAQKIKAKHQAETSTSSIGPVDTALIQNAAKNAQQPDSAAQPQEQFALLRDGIAKFNNGRFDEALKIFSAVAATKQAKSSLGQLWQGMVYNEIFRYNDAKNILIKYMKHRDDTGPNSARALNGLGFACANLGLIDEAQGYFDRALAITSKLNGPDRVVHAQNLRGMAELAMHRRAFGTAQQMLTEALKINQQLGAPELEIAYVENDLGQANEYLRKFDDARKCYDTALTIRQNKLQGGNPLIGYSLTCIASVDFAQHRYAESEAHFKQALSLAKQNLLDESLTDMQKNKYQLDVATISQSLGALAEAQKKFPQALSYYQTAIQIQQSLRGPADAQVLSLRETYLKLQRKVPKTKAR